MKCPVRAVQWAVVDDLMKKEILHHNLCTSQRWWFPDFESLRFLFSQLTNYNSVRIWNILVHLTNMKIRVCFQELSLPITKVLYSDSFWWSCERRYFFTPMWYLVRKHFVDSATFISPLIFQLIYKLLTGKFVMLNLVMHIWFLEQIILQIVLKIVQF